ncbi:MAG: FtsX-like permease family protein, partial [Gammaproteobacteria bacterium]|nr:FtsX-like permease family protein [Gammaproteobacteria bacterium]
VINTLSMAIMERTREIGSLSAMGTFQSELLSIFVLEAALLGLMGACSGMLITGGLTVYLQFAEFIMPPPPGMTQGYPLSIAFSLPMYLKTSAALVIVIILGAFLTARKGINKPIIEALTHV